MKDMLSDSEDQLHLYGYETLANATNTFHVENKLGKGGFGSVYKVYQVFVRFFAEPYAVWTVKNSIIV